MNKSKIDELIPSAYDLLAEYGIAKNNVIVKTFRGQISTFGAAISGGSLLAAVSFFSDEGSATVDRVALTKAIYSLITGKKADGKAALFEYVKTEITAGREAKCKEDILNAALAIKLAMNVYSLSDK